MTAIWLTFFSSIVLNFAPVSVAYIPDGGFDFPPGYAFNHNFTANLLWTLGSTQKIQWTTNIDAYSIALYQENLDPLDDTAQAIDPSIYST